MFSSPSTATRIWAESAALSGLFMLLSCQLSSTALAVGEARAKGMGPNKLPFEKLRLG